MASVQDPMPETDQIPSSGPGGFEEAVSKGSDDTMLATIILATAIIIAIFGGLLWKKFGTASVSKIDDFDWNSGGTNEFSPPPEREAYIEAKKKLNVKIAEEKTTLKKKLMLRCIKTIPMLYELQNGGPSVDRLYKKGMLTDGEYDRIKKIKDYIDVEFPEVQQEADELESGWSEAIWPQANQYHMLQTKMMEGNKGEEESVDDSDNISITMPAAGANATSPKNAEAINVNHESTREAPSNRSEPAVPKTEKEKALHAERIAQELLAEENKKIKKGKPAKGAKK